jgi:hypothetical protein
VVTIAESRIQTLSRGCGSFFAWAKWLNHAG